MNVAAAVAPDLIEPIMGHRSWTVRIHPSGEPRLCSPYRRVIWSPGEPVRARCTTTIAATAVGFRRTRPVGGGHPAPSEGCECGVHAWRDPAPALADAAGSRGLRAVTGEAALWGVVVAHERGWRAARAYPGALRVHPATTDGLCFAFSWEAGELRAVDAAELRAALAEVYGVPVAIDPGESLLGPVPRRAPAARRLPRIRLGDGPVADGAGAAGRADRLARWLLRTPG